MPLADYSGFGVTDYYGSMIINANDMYHKRNLLLKLTTSIVLKGNQPLNIYQLIMEGFDLICFFNLHVSLSINKKPGRP